MIPWLLAVALAADRPTYPCPLDAVPDGWIAISLAGKVELHAPDGALVGAVDTGTKFPGAASVHCGGGIVKITVQPEGHQTLSLMMFDLDFTDVIASWAPFDPIEDACAIAKSRMEDAKYGDAIAALAKAPPADPRVVRERIAIGKAAFAAATATKEPAAAEAAFQVALATLDAGWTPAERLDVQLHWGQWLIGAGRSADGLAVLKAATAADPTSADAALTLADGLWSAGDRDGAKVEYLRATGLLGAIPLPERLKERCKACLKVAAPK
jgi:hypothetical protein